MSETLKGMTARELTEHILYYSNQLAEAERQIRLANDSLAVLGTNVQEQLDKIKHEQTTST